uniref:Uncharacterized protein n=1 Tax=Arundo donax TaxID=35708 RepID=A0A0A9H557_ARUDO
MKMHAMSYIRNLHQEKNSREAAA